jgi:ubiquinone/menaquinone biosynthesis C-methylase UbiE
VTVVEIGPGTGINFNYLPPGINWIGLEPNKAFHPIILRNAEAMDIRANLISSVAEKIDLPGESADAEISTLVLCSVKDVKQTIQEIKRILKKGGRLIFVEHVAAEKKTGLRRTQDILNPVNRFFADGCNCNRETWTTIRDAGFTSVTLQHEKLKGTLPLHAPHIFGYAIK